MPMLINEIFYSIQGEGRLTGVPSVFIRTSGCNLRCGWCDTPQTSWSPQGDTWTIDDLIVTLTAFQARHCVLTGGEPMIAPGIKELASRLHGLGQHITIETAGTIAPNGIACDLASISPKLMNANPGDRVDQSWRERHEKRRLNLKILAQWINHYDVQLKFVVARQRDVDEVVNLMSDLPPISADRVMLMPEGVTSDQLAQRRDLISRVCLEHGFRYCHRLHIDLFGNTPGT